MDPQLNNREQLYQVGAFLPDELDNIATRIRSAWLVEHTEDDAHGDIHAWSLTLLKDPTAGHTGNIVIGGTVTEQGRSAAQGFWIDEPYNAANFNAGTGTWTVQIGDQITFAYMLIGKALTVAFYIDTSTLSLNTASVIIAVPGTPFVAAKTVMDTVFTQDSGGQAIGQIEILAGASQMQITKPGGNFLAGAGNDVYMRGVFTFPIR